MPCATGFAGNHSGNFSFGNRWKIAVSAETLPVTMALATLPWLPLLAGNQPWQPRWQPPARFAPALRTYGANLCANRPLRKAKCVLLLRTSLPTNAVRTRPGAFRALQLRDYRARNTARNSAFCCNRLCNRLSCYRSSASVGLVSELSLFMDIKNHQSCPSTASPRRPDARIQSDYPWRRVALR